MKKRATKRPMKKSTVPKRAPKKGARALSQAEQRLLKQRFAEFQSASRAWNEALILVTQGDTGLVVTQDLTTVVRKEKG